MLTNPFIRFLKKKFFNKILLIYSLIVLFAMSFFVIIVSNTIGSINLNNAITYNKMVLRNLNGYFDNKYQSIRKVLEKTYNDSFLQPEALDFIMNNYDKVSDEYINLKPKFDKYFMSVFEQDKDIYNVIVYKKSSEELYQYSRDFLDEFASSEFHYPERLNQVKEKDSYVRIIPALAPDYLKVNHKMVFTMSINIKELDTTNVIGLLMIDFDTNGISSYLSQYGDSLKGNIMILTRNGNVIFDSSNKYYKKTYPYFNLLKNTKNSIKINNELNIINVDTDNSSGVIVVGIISEKEIFKTIKNLRTTILIVSLFSIITIIILTGISTTLFSKRIKSLSEAMKKVHTGNLYARIPVKNSEDEIGEISLSFNKMCDNLKEYIEKVYISDIKQKSAELIALQSQINPHFLYNTLEAIRMNAVAFGDNETSEMIYILSQLFRNSIKEDPIIKIMDEIMYSKLYLNLFKMRYGDKLSVQFNIDDDILEYGIIKHLIQPVIENYIVHGYDIDNEANNVIINGYKDSVYILLVISDNGKGIAEEKLNAIKKSLEHFGMTANGSIGLANVNERIKIIYGKECGLDISCEEGKGTTVTVRILAKTKEELKYNV